MLSEKSIKNKIIAFIILTSIIISFFYIKPNINIFNYNNASIDEVVNKLSNNFQITIVKKENDNILEMNVICDEYICEYISDSLIYKDVLEYNGKYYSLSEIDDIEQAKFIEVEEDFNVFNKKYYNLELIKNLILSSNKKNVDFNNFELVISLKDYLKEYNYLYEQVNKTEEDIDINIKYTIINDMVKNIIIDYKDIDSYFNNTSYDILEYNITINKLNNIDYLPLKEYIDSL